MGRGAACGSHPSPTTSALNGSVQPPPGEPMGARNAATATAALVQVEVVEVEREVEPELELLLLLPLLVELELELAQRWMMPPQQQWRSWPRGVPLVGWQRAS